MTEMTEENKIKGNFPNLRFPEFQGEWKRYKVSDILDFFSTNSLSWDQLEYSGDNIYNLHYGLIHKNLPTQIDLKTCTLPNIKEGFEPVNYTLCEDGDIVFADASEDTNDVGIVVLR
jgi:type I restriction enzyme S subunit